MGARGARSAGSPKNGRADYPPDIAGVSVASSAPSGTGSSADANAARTKGWTFLDCEVILSRTRRKPTFKRISPSQLLGSEDKHRTSIHT